ncbi:MAG: HAD hydrolase-like protein [Desulforegulaceae bacterium]|nr:HAD hydrolase-like protein [Desulforegulaceae bacterium]
MSDIKLVLLDFGGVIAEEGFKKGINELALKFDFDVEKLKKIAFDLVYDCGFTSGKADSDKFWDLFKEKTKISESNSNLTEFILKRFIIRDEMINFAKWLKTQNIKTAILSDQTNWLDILDKKYDFFKYFDKVFNSYYLGITKKDPEIFDLALEEMDELPENTLFADDHNPHIQRAAAKKINGILFKDMNDFKKQIKEYFIDPEF